MILTAIISTVVGLAYVGLGTVRFVVATEAVLLYAVKLDIPRIFPSWLPEIGRRWFAPMFRLSARAFFLGCAYTHFEISAHALIGDLPPDYGNLLHLSVMTIQAIGAWMFLAVLSFMATVLEGDRVA